MGTWEYGRVAGVRFDGPWISGLDMLVDGGSMMGAQRLVRDLWRTKESSQVVVSVPTTG